MNILVTGSNGYIGSVLVEYLLDRNHNVTAFDRLMYDKTSLLHYVRHPRFNFIKGDVRNKEELLREANKNDVIISLAALVGAPLCKENPTDAILVNYEANKWLCDNKSKDQLIIYPMTNSGYGTTDGKSVTTEESELNPITLYGKTKVDAEKVVRQVDNHVVLRLATVFGVSPRMRTDLLVNNLVLKALKDRTLVLYEAEYMRNYIHVRDICRAIVHSLDEYVLNNVYNVGNDAINMSKMQLCEKIKNHVEVEIIKAEYTKDVDQRNYVISSQKFYDTGFSCLYDLDDGIKELLKAYKMIDEPKYANY